jgi:hypothetical protein
VRRFFLAILVLLSGCASAQWTTGDSIRQASIVALQVVDWRQTRTIATEMVPAYTVDHGGGASTTYNARPRFCEQNPILGEHPSVGKVNAFFITAIAANALVSYLLPPTWRMGWQYISIGYEGNVVLDNYRAGIRW